MKRYLPKRLDISSQSTICALSLLTLVGWLLMLPSPTALGADGVQSARARWTPVRSASQPNLPQTQHQRPSQSASIRQATFQDSGNPTPTDAADLPAPLADPAGIGTEPIASPIPNSTADSAVPITGDEVIVHDGHYAEGTVYEGVHYGVGGYTGSCDSPGCNSCGSPTGFFPFLGSALFGCRGGSCDGMGCASGCDAGGCDGIGCDGCNTCCPGVWSPCLTLSRPVDGWVSVEGLAWQLDGMDTPPLVTTSPAGTARTAAGVLGQTGTTTLFGGELLDDTADGIRVRAGFWLDPCHQWALQLEFFELERLRESFFQNSTGDPILARPFFNALTGAEDSELVAFPNVLQGSVSVDADTQLQGWSIHARRLLLASCGCGDAICAHLPCKYDSRTSLILGYRWMELDDQLRITEDLQSLDANNPGTFVINDRFATRNQFNGIDMGFLYRRQRGCWSLDLSARLALGNNRQTVRINGDTAITENGTTQNFTGGLLAQRTNIGLFKRDRFTVIPELGATLGYQITPRLRATVGYTFIYWSQVVRAGDQIDPDVNPNLLPPEANPFSGPLRPEFRFVDSDYWAQGINYGAEFRW